MAELDSSAATALELIRAAGRPPADQLSPAEARIGYLQARGALSPQPPAITHVGDLDAQGRNGAIPLRLYRDGDDEAARGCLVYFHGGGWVIGDRDTHDVVCRQIAQRSRAVVISVDYRLGPEHKFPAAVEDAIDATAWVAKHADELGIDAKRLAVGGDSAGGNLAAVVAIDARDNAGPAIAMQALVYPSTDMLGSTESHEAFAENYMLTKSMMTYFRAHYLRSADDKADWRASPMRAAQHDGLPPALVITAGFDPLRDEGEAYARRLAERGVAVTLRRFPGQIHGFLTMGRVIPEAGEAVDEIVATMAARGV